MTQMNPLPTFSNDQHVTHLYPPCGPTPIILLQVS